ncbi:hypothetical protein B0F90DRAFT_1814541 [Multifurca ochricompacta]|uniref:Uncharacterized protein n=1 Tax=Multifurca ochricompacta TaxID=376703 RepID=A0AAD4QS82_9AGAM|nr:hypothetical protein B0F90DRAFT_1814541 [Multifurca ochricompacta]
MTSLLSALKGIIGPDSPKKVEFPTSTGETLVSDVPLVHDDDGIFENAHRRTDHAAGVGVVDIIDDLVNESVNEVVDNDVPNDVHGHSHTPPILLSPVQIGLVPSIPFPHVGSTTLTRDDSIDSGYAETWVGPTPFSLSPPQLNRLSSTLDILSSPFGSPLSRHSCTPYSIDIATPPSLNAGAQRVPPFHISAESVTLGSATPARQSPLHALAPERIGIENANLSNETFEGLDLSPNVMARSPAEMLLFPMPPCEIPVCSDPSSSEEAGSKRMSWISHPSSQSLPPRAASAGSSSAPCSAAALVGVQERPHSAVDMLPWPHHPDSRVTSSLLSDYTTCASSPLLETPISSSSSQADGPAPFAIESPVSLSAIDLVAHSFPSSSKNSSADKSPPRSAPIHGPQRTPNQRRTSFTTWSLLGADGIVYPLQERFLLASETP